MRIKVGVSRSIGLVALCLAVCSCSHGSASLLEDGVESEQRLSRMNMVVLDAAGTRSERSAADVSGFVEIHCKAVLDADLEPRPATNPCDDPPTTECQAAVCQSQIELCRALTFREIAQAAAPVELQAASGAVAYTLPPQDAESRVASEQAAQVAAARALGYAGDGLLTACGEADLTSIVSPFDPPNKLEEPMELLASTLVEALRVGEEAAEAGARAALGVADRDRAGVSDLGRAARLSWFDDNLSRLVAAQSHTGGVVFGAVDTPTWSFEAGDYIDDPSLPYRTGADATTLAEEGIGSQPPCRGNCQVALGALRRSGVPMTDILDSTVTLDALSATSISRTEARLGVDLFDGTNAAAFAGGLDVSSDALRRAREWMRHETVVFALPTGILTGDLPAPPLPDGTAQTVTGYDSTTMSPPQAPPAMHYITAARTSTLWNFEEAFSGTNSTRLPILRPERAHLFAYANAVAAEAMARSDADLSPAPHAEAGGIRRILSTFSTMARARKAVDTELCVGATSMRIRLFGADREPTNNGGEFLLLQGLDQLRCAVDGVVGGQPCTLSGDAPVDGFQTISGPARLSRRRAVEWDIAIPMGANPPTLYIVRTRGGFKGPGAYEAIAGIPASGLTSHTGKCTSIPFDYLSNGAAGRDFEVDDDARPAHACSNLPERLPLEDEIIEDGDPYEDSWQHHLRVAASTAAHADDLGQNLIRTGLEMEVQAQRAVDEIQTLCGVHINLDQLVGTDGSLQELIDSTDSCNESVGDFSCSTGYECMGTECVVTGLFGEAGSSQREALEECFGVGDAGSIVEVVALGRHTLCAYRPATQPHRLCVGSSEPCPRVRQPDTTCQAPTDWDTSLGAVEVVQVTNDSVVMGEPTDIGEVLGVVGSVAPGGAPPAGATVPPIQSVPDMCAALKEGRTSGDEFGYAHPVWERIRGVDEQSHFWNFANIQYWAGRIGWTGEPRDYSYLTLDGVPVRNNDGEVVGQTGRVATGPATAWPCGGTTDPATLAGEAGALTETRINCGTQLHRARLNWRMGRAASTLAALSAVGMDNIRYPAFYYGYGGADMSALDGTVPAGAYKRASYIPANGSISGNVWGPIGIVDGSDLWNAPNGFRVEAHPDGASVFEPVVSSNSLRPLAFLNFGTRFADDDYVRAEYLASVLWQGLGSDPVDSSGTSHDFFNLLQNQSPARPRSLFWNAIAQRGDAWDTEYIRHGRADHDGNTRANELTSLFSAPIFDLVHDTGTYRNVASIFAYDLNGQVAPRGYGLRVTRRDVLDALELVCTVASYQPPPPGMTSDGEQVPVITSVDDIASVRRYAERLAVGFDALARVQVVQDVPKEVVDNVRIDDVGDSTSDRARNPDVPSGEYGRQIVAVSQQLRTIGRAPTDIAGALRQLSGELDTMRRDQEIFEREAQITFLQVTVGLLNDSLSCMNMASGPNVGTAVAGCGIIGAIRVLETAITALQMENLTAAQMNRFERFRLSVTGILDTIESRRVDFINAVDDLRNSLSTLREARASAQSQLARAVFASSDAGGRHYQTNTVMRRSYDINLQRYRSAHRAAVRSAAVARMAIEQRFGVDLDNQMCGQLVEPPNTWASDVCNATGVNYGALRDASVEVDDDTIRQMFIGDYVRRLEQYVESYRFDYPYSSGDDTMVMSMRDDVVRARGVCVDVSRNLVGTSNDLLARQMPLDATASDSGPAWKARGCSTSLAENCVSVSRDRGPRWSVVGASETPPVVGRIESQPPRGFTVTFAPRTSEPYAGDYQNGASLSQELILPTGIYRLSWYEKTSGTYAPTVDLRVSGTTPSSTTVHTVSARAMVDGWTRKMRFVTVTSAQSEAPMLVGVFSATVPSTEQHSIQVAGLQLENVTYSDVEAIAPTSADWPALFEATTAPGYARFEDCRSGTPREFQGGWTRGCTQLCSGGFSERCSEGEEPTEVCFYELMFSLSEDQLLARGGQFGGGFAFGNYNYRTGDIAVNLVGTGTRRCGDGESCYATASVPFSLIHTPNAGDSTGGSAYSVRTHDGSLHPVQLFEGRIESGRALAAERYLTNPLSSADRALLSDYTRREMRGRPMTGNYRLILWDNGSLAFENVEDVQVLWNYRYFTRTGEPYVCE